MDVSTVSTASPDNGYPKAIPFDLLTTLLNSWSLWDRVAGFEQAGHMWRAEYLWLTYGCGTYVPYGAMVQQAAQNVGLLAPASATLEANWLQLAPWSGTMQALAQLQSHCKPAVATNCSEWLGRQAAMLLSIAWDVVITAEQAGVYKPDPKPYCMALEQLGVDAADATFVVGFSHDTFGTTIVGPRTHWRNRIGPMPVEGVQLPEITSSTLDDLLPWAHRFAA